MADAPWRGDACSLVDAFRRGERSATEELEATLAAIDASQLNAFAFLDADQARAAAVDADVSLPFGGVPIGVKELDRVAGWPDTQASVRIAYCALLPPCRHFGSDPQRNRTNDPGRPQAHPGYPG